VGGGRSNKDRLKKWMYRVSHHRLIAVIGALLSIGAIGAQTVDTALIRRDVAPPSTDFTTYVEGEIIQVSIPSNWRELPGSNAVTFAPEGAYGNAGVKSVFTHGVGLGLIRNDKDDLQVTTNDFIESQVLFASGPSEPLHYGNVTIADRPAIRTVLTTRSEATNQPEQIEVYTTLLHNGTVLYLLAVTPRDRASEYVDTFRRVVGSIEIRDCDSCVPK
jgi:hypothetical protein